MRSDAAILGFFPDEIANEISKKEEGLAYSTNCDKTPLYDGSGFIGYMTTRKTYHNISWTWTYE